MALTKFELPEDTLPPHQRFSILAAYQLNNKKIIKLRYPFGKVDWNGNFSSSSDEWTPELRHIAG
jgi:hypothetical protein